MASAGLYRQQGSLSVGGGRPEQGVRDKSLCARCMRSANAYVGWLRVDAEAQRVGVFLLAYLFCFAVDVTLSERGLVAGLAGDILRSLIFSCVLGGVVYAMRLAAMPPDSRHSYGYVTRHACMCCTHTSS